MIYILDDFLDKEFLAIVQNYLENDFKKTISGGKDFYVLESNEDFDNYVLGVLQNAEGRELENILSFFRVATNSSIVTGKHKNLFLQI